jgi:hypothetical protein
MFPLAEPNPVICVVNKPCLSPIALRRRRRRRRRRQKAVVVGLQDDIGLQETT